MKTEARAMCRFWWYKRNVKCAVFFLLIVGLVYFHKSENPSCSVGEIWETAKSSNGCNQLQSAVTHEDGVELCLNGKRITNGNMDIEYCPAINNRGDSAYVRVAFERKGSDSQVLLNGEKILDNGTICSHLKMTEDQLLFSSFSAKNNFSSFWVVSIKDKKKKVLKNFENACIDDICILQDGHAAIIVEDMAKGRAYALYDADLQDGSVSLVMETTNKLLMREDANGGVSVDKIGMTTGENNQILLNAWYWFYHYQYGEPFANGNDFWGRISWNESYRLHGILELFRKTEDEEIKDMLRIAVKNILDARNEKIGVTEDVFNPPFLWSSKRYSLEGKPIALMADNGMILDALLSVANAGVLDEEKANEVYDVAAKAFDYYEAYYDGNGHYIFQPGSPFHLDGVVLPWNQQNAMATAFLELWRATGEARYLERCEELIEAFRAEWEEQGGMVCWYYWPKWFYDGWGEESGISQNTKSRKSTDIEDVPFEDISHAGINARIVAKYYRMRPDGIITSMDMEKIQNNMAEWCFENGFSASIGGGGDVSYRSVPSDGWGYFHNEHLKRYLCYGRPRTAVEWDSQAFFGLAAQYYEPKTEPDFLEVDRYEYRFGGQLEYRETFSLQEEDVKAFVKESYGGTKF